jgi:transcriptional regulator with XRE-family HTH domain
MSAVEEIYAQVGEQITIARKAIGLSQEELGGFLG